MRGSCPRLAADLLELPAHLSQAHAIQADPCKDQTNNVRLGLHHLKACLAAALLPAHIAVAEGGARQSADGAGACRVAATTERILARSYSAITP